MVKKLRKAGRELEPIEQTDFRGDEPMSATGQ
jgi:hypothetical protein